MKKHFFIIFIVLYGMYSYGQDVQYDQSPEYPRESTDNTLRIVAFGNSITAQRSSVQQVFAQRLPDLLTAEGITAEVINSGVGSSHTGILSDNSFAKVKHALERFETDVLAHHPNIVIIGFGTNDAYIDDNRQDGKSRISLPKYQQNLEYMINILYQRDIRVILMAPSPLASPRPIFQNTRLLEYVRVVRKLSTDYGTGLSDNYQLFMDYQENGRRYETLLPDGVHPNDEGHRIIAENLVEQIKKIVMK